MVCYFVKHSKITGRSCDFVLLGGHQEDEEEVLLLGGGHEPQGGQEPQETLPRQRHQTEGGL